MESSSASSFGIGAKERAPTSCDEDVATAREFTT
jgi:hypothetical protein